MFAISVLAQAEMQSRLLMPESWFAIVSQISVSWLTGDLTNQNAESAISHDKQIRQESRLTSVDLNLKNIVYWRLSAVEIKKTFLCSFMFISCFMYIWKDNRSRAAWIEALQLSVTTRQLKSHKTVFVTRAGKMSQNVHGLIMSYRPFLFYFDFRFL